LNEHITADASPPKQERQARLLECMEIFIHHAQQPTTRTPFSRMTATPGTIHGAPGPRRAFLVGARGADRCEARGATCSRRGVRARPFYSGKNSPGTAIGTLRAQTRGVEAARTHA
jgi:hypothetical protein